MGFVKRYLDKRRMNKSFAPHQITSSKPVVTEFTLDFLEIIFNFTSDQDDVIHFAAVCQDWRRTVLSSSLRRHHHFTNVMPKKCRMEIVSNLEWGDLPRIFQSMHLKNWKYRSIEQFKELAMCQNLKELHLEQCMVEIPSVSFSYLTRLTVDIYYTMDSENQMNIIANKMVNLTYLHVNTSYHVVSNYFTEIANGKLHKLETLYLIIDFPTTNENIQQLFESPNLPMLKQLSMNPNIDTIASIENAKFQLTQLSFQSMRLQGDSVKNLIVSQRNITSLDLRNVIIQPSQVGLIRQLVNLKELLLTNCTIQHADLFASFKLEKIYWGSRSLTSNTLSKITCSSTHLKYLGLFDANVEDDLFFVISKLNSLKELVLEKCIFKSKCTPSTLPDLDRVTIIHSTLLPCHYRCIGDISTLKYLHIEDREITMEGLEYVTCGNLVQLETLELNYTFLNSLFWTTHNVNLPNLTHCDFTENFKLHEDSLIHFSKCNLKKLRSIRISDVPGTLHLLEGLKELEKLEVVRIGNNQNANVHAARKVCKTMNKKYIFNDIIDSSLTRYDWLE